MPTGDEYRLKALELCQKANGELSHKLKSEYEHLAFAYLRLAEMADRNVLTDPLVKLDQDEQLSGSTLRAE